ncbi:MAG: type II toxin-antitoxin system RelE/ParE family toxin [Gammaproteobacteria bacterium]|nr:type II toxin-antitoxin system RelE/ParE family toxin [Gammaproteobacteria bacterium]
MPLRSLWPGSAYEIYAYATDRYRCQIEEFLTNLSKRDQKKMTALLTRAAHHGPPRNREKCQKMVGEDFWEFKPSDQQRVFWCYDPGKRKRIVLLHGFTKKSGRTPKNELEAGRSAYREYLQELRIARKERE